MLKLSLSTTNSKLIVNNILIVYRIKLVVIIDIIFRELASLYALSSNLSYLMLSNLSNKTYAANKLIQLYLQFHHSLLKSPYCLPVLLFSFLLLGLLIKAATQGQALNQSINSPFLQSFQQCNW